MFQQILQSFAVKALVAIINFSILIISSKFLGISSRGEISLFLLNLTIVQGISDVYTGYSIVYFVPKYDLKKILIYGFSLTIFCCLLSNGLIVFLNKQIQGYESLGFIISIFVVLNTFNSMLLLGKEAIRSFNFLAFLQPFLLFIGILLSVFYFRIYTLQSYIWPLLFSFLISFLISSFVLFKNLKRQNKSISNFSLIEILKNGFYLQSALILFVFCNRYSFYLLTDNKKVGLYSSACMLMESVLLIVNSMTPILLSKTVNQSSPINLARQALSFAKIAFLSGGAIVLIILLIPENFILFFLGKEFKGIKTLMTAYSPAILMLSFFTIINNYFSGIGKQKFVLLSYMFGLLVTFCLAPLLIQRFDVLGAALVANISYAVILVTVLFLFFGISKMKWAEIFKPKLEFGFFIKLIKNEV